MREPTLDSQFIVMGVMDAMDEMDDMADLMDEHLNDALSGIFTEEGSEESSCTSSVYSLSDDW